MLQPIGLASSSGQSRSEWTPVTSWSLWSMSCIETGGGGGEVVVAVVVVVVVVAVVVAAAAVGVAA